MNTLSLQIKNKDGLILAENIQEDEVNLVYTGTYEEGDRIHLHIEKENIFVVLQIDDGMNPALVYLTEKEFVFNIPFGEKRVSYSPKVFHGEKHLITARVATVAEISTYRNLARNEVDQHIHYGCYPHAVANVETRGESVFAARNAIDGITENHSHGEWPYQSWGINQQDDAEIQIEFGRNVEIDKMVLYTRADFPHDNYWKKVTFRFSDGSKLVCDLVKTDKPQTITFDKKLVEWVTLGELIKSDDPSPFPALTQWEVYGVEYKK